MVGDPCAHGRQGLTEKNYYFSYRLKLRQAVTQGKLTVDIADIVSSCVHMHVNRLIRASQRLHELVLYDFLAQSYGGRLAKESRSQVGSPLLR
jgi:thiopeptide-type bacteriocin biosynthesis protein